MLTSSQANIRPKVLVEEPTVKEKPGLSLAHVLFGLPYPDSWSLECSTVELSPDSSLLLDCPNATHLSRLLRHWP